MEPRKTHQRPSYALHAAGPRARERNLAGMNVLGRTFAPLIARLQGEETWAAPGGAGDSPGESPWRGRGAAHRLCGAGCDGGTVAVGPGSRTGEAVARHGGG
jgi:hypothetical protein